MRALIIGCGYVGQRLGASLVKAGHEVSGVRRNPDSAAELEALGIRPVLADVSQPDQLERLPLGCDWIVWCAATSGGGVEGYRRTYLDASRALLRWLKPQAIRKLVYTGSTGVYGQARGEEVDETSATVPAAPTARILVEAEALFREAAWSQAVPAVILRLAGIYGPGRGYWVKQFVSGAARLDGDGSRILNMVHRDDIVQAILAALELAEPGSVWNVVDDEPVTQLGLFRWLAARLRRPLPPAAEAPTPSGGKQRPGSKRVRNDRLRRDLRVNLMYPTFREGFEAELTRLGL